MAETQRVCVTGASGYVAGVLIDLLLKSESPKYSVGGTVRSLANKEKVAHLQKSYPGLELFEADLLTDGSFDAAFVGCGVVFHTASPFQLQVEDPQRDLVDPAVNGTRNVLTAAAKAGVKKVVLTSSCAAVVAASEITATRVFTEEDWNLESSLDNAPYRFSKTMAEKEAWKLSKELGFELAVINPAFVMGPPVSTRTDGTSIGTVKWLLEGGAKEGAMPMVLGCVDVRDVGLAHIRAAERSEATGKRFILSSEKAYAQLEMAAMIKAALEKIGGAEKLIANLPTTQKGDAPLPALYNHSQAETVLGIDFKPLEQTLSEMVAFFLDNGIVSK
eukprot:CAMPEP_0205818472 /NCGR_PEP_ID=MMETSP0206-20130828/389_1 /ASSEMBLY_ACC=CAM_ASM_000279 /TAXON_ID=36767 /ORGANISM="Euplotes focardii, Strain TN1" /LENGTH=331 /DNA_ID=CAMNT_0053110855 /DNA_START=30 /DNA_END=1025 /DNA_ORIENTATION=+